MRRLISSVFIIHSAGAGAMGYRPENIAADSAWLVEIQERIEKYDSVFEAAGWEFYSTGIEPERLEDSGSKLWEIVFYKYNRQRLERIQGLFENEVLARTARVGYIDFLSRWSYLGSGISTLRNRLIETLINYRASLENKHPASDPAWQTASEAWRSMRENSWHEGASVGSKIARGLKELVERRNEVARKLDYHDFYEMKLSAIGMTEENLFDILTRIELETREPYRVLARRMMEFWQTDALMPWDFGILFSPSLDVLDSHLNRDSLLTILFRTMAGLGYGVDSLSVTMDLDPRPAKIRKSICFPVHVPDDIRILANVHSGFGSYRTIFHEYGHALHFLHIDQPYLMLRQSPASSFSEGMAEFNESILLEPEWLIRYAGIPDSLVDLVVDALADARIISVRLLLAKIYFERELYRTDAKEPGRLYRQIMSEIAYCGQPEFDDAWASVIHFTDNPASFHNYILGGMIAAQTAAYLKRTNGSIVDNPATARFMIESYFTPGASKDWFDLVEKATGEPLNAKYYIDLLLGRNLQEDDKK